MSIVERVRVLNLPLDELVVIGSGLLDALELRQARDVDLLVTEELFRRLASNDTYTQGIRDGSKYLMGDTVEFWTDWGSAIPDFDAALQQSVKIGGVRFLSPSALIREKERMGRAKDHDDIRLLETFLQVNPEKF